MKIYDCEEVYWPTFTLGFMGNYSSDNYNTLFETALRTRAKSKFLYWLTELYVGPFPQHPVAALKGWPPACWDIDSNRLPVEFL